MTKLRTFFLFVCLGFSFIDAHSDTALSISLTLNPIKIHAYEPVGALVVLKNESDKPLTLSTRPNLEPTFEIGLKGKTLEWYVKPHTRSDEAANSIVGAHETLSIYTRLNINSTGDHLFARPGTYTVVTDYGKFGQAKQTIEVQPTDPLDVAAVKYLDNHPLYRYFNAENVRDMLVSTQEGKAWGKEDPSILLESFIQLFPQSRYAQWARYALLSVKSAPFTLILWQLNQLTEAEKVVNKGPITGLDMVRQDLEALATQSEQAIAAQCWIEAGQMAALSWQDLQADADFNRAIKTEPNAVIKAQIDSFKKLLDHILPLTTSRPEDILKSTIQQLNDQYYDVEGFRDDHPKEDREYCKAWMKLSEQYQSGKMSAAEYYEKLAELRKFYITTYSKPLSPQEWKRRQQKRMAR